MAFEPREKDTQLKKAFLLSLTNSGRRFLLSTNDLPDEDGQVRRYVRLHEVPNVAAFECQPNV